MTVCKFPKATYLFIFFIKFLPSISFSLNFSGYIKIIGYFSFSQIVSTFGLEKRVIIMERTFPSSSLEIILKVFESILSTIFILIKDFVYLERFINLHLSLAKSYTTILPFDNPAKI